MHRQQYVCYIEKVSKHYMATLINLFTQTLTMGFIAGLREKGLGFVFPVIMSEYSLHIRKCISLIIQMPSL